MLDEYIEVMKPKMVHIGHDEYFTPIDQCPRCKGKDYGELYAQDVRKTYDYLAKRGIHIAMWGDMLLQGVRGAVPHRRVRRPDGAIARRLPCLPRRSGKWCRKTS